MPHRIELVTETCHDARLYFGSRGLVCQRIRKHWTVCLSPRPCTHQRPLSYQRNEVVGAHRFFLSVSSGEDGRQSAIVHDMRSCGSQTARHNRGIAEARLHRSYTNFRTRSCTSCLKSNCVAPGFVPSCSTDRITTANQFTDSRQRTTSRSWHCLAQEFRET